ncbi:MAG TPA: SGNH/GDSL hydrolase family protein [Actinomycetota bacterium]
MTAVCCYGDSNTWGYEASTEMRLPRWRRWPGVMQRVLGDDVHVIEEGLNGRTTVFDDPFQPGRNGLAHLDVVLATHAPLDLVIIWLGTNDLFVPGGLTAQDAARGAMTLAEVARASEAGPDDEPPEVLLLVSPPFGPLGAWEHDSPHGELESRGFADAFTRLADDAGVPLLDLAPIAESSPIDGIHFEASDHDAIGHAVAAKVGEMLGAG